MWWNNWVGRSTGADQDEAEKYCPHEYSTSGAWQSRILDRDAMKQAAQDLSIIAGVATRVLLQPNVPPASLPGESGNGLDDLPVAAEEIRAALLDTFDRQQQIGAAARLVARHLILGHSPKALIATLAHALLREDAGFHAYQIIEAGVRQFHEWGNCDQGRHILIAVARYLAAHFPTQRAQLQTADIASRLTRGGELHREAQAMG
jgi:hypothetical protein